MRHVEKGLSRVRDEWAGENSRTWSRACSRVWPWTRWTRWTRWMRRKLVARASTGLMVPRCGGVIIGLRTLMLHSNAVRARSESRSLRSRSTIRIPRTCCHSWRGRWNRRARRRVSKVSSRWPIPHGCIAQSTGAAWPCCESVRGATRPTMISGPLCPIVNCRCGCGGIMRRNDCGGGSAKDGGREASTTVPVDGGSFHAGWAARSGPN